MNYEVARRFIDSINQSKCDEDKILSVRHLIAKRLCMPFNSFWTDIISDMANTDDEDDIVNDTKLLLDYYRDNSEFRDFYTHTVDASSNEFYEYINEYTSAKSLVIAAMFTCEYNDDKLNEVADKLIHWYFDDRRKTEMLMGGGIIILEQI